MITRYKGGDLISTSSAVQRISTRDPAIFSPLKFSFYKRLTSATLTMPPHPVII